MISSSREPALEMERGREVREEKGREGWEEKQGRREEGTNPAPPPLLRSYSRPVSHSVTPEPGRSPSLCSLQLRWEPSQTQMPLYSFLLYT